MKEKMIFGKRGERIRIKSGSEDVSPKAGTRNKSVSFHRGQNISVFWLRLVCLAFSNFDIITQFGVKPDREEDE